MRIRDVLHSKGSDVVTVEPDDPILTAVRVLSEYRIGAVPVQSGDGLVGILSERDILNLAAKDHSLLGTARVRDIMTKDVVTGTLGDALDQVMNVMTENRIRHLPIVVDGRLAGIVSIGDVVNAVRRRVEDENHHLKGYIHGVAG